jgi:parallel beta-helix repeat protein
MNKYALILPLVILSFFLGYFASSSKMEHFYTIATVTTVLVAIAGYLLFLKHQKVGDSKRTRKTEVATAFIAVLLFSTLIGVQLVNLAEANFIPPPNHASGIFIRSDGSVDPSTASIQRVGDVYTFTGDVSVGIAVQRSDVIIDGDGYQLIGGSGGTGFYLQSVNNVTVQNFNIQGFNYGFYLHHTNNSIVKRNSVTGSGIVVTQRSCYNQIVENNVTGGGISLNFGNDNIVLHNNVGGISIVFSTNITLGNNRIADDERVDVELLYTDVGGGISVDNSGNCNIFGNTIERKIVGINIWHCTSLNFSNNTLKDNQVGFKLWGCDLQHNLHSIDTTNTVDGKPVYFLVNQSDFQVPTNAGWIAAVNCANITVENWASTPNWDSILFIDTRDSKILNSKLTGNFNAIRFDSVYNCTISGNLIDNNGYAAFYFEGAVNCTITENNAVDNFCYFNIWHDSANNTFFYNNFSGNWTGSPGDRDSHNFWDNGLEGNYWEEYNGTDANGNNVGDTPYVIDTYSNSVDRYPLMNPVEIPDPKIPDIIPEFPTWTTMPLVLAVFTVAVTIYKRRLRKLRNKKRMSCKHELFERK